MITAEAVNGIARVWEMYQDEMREVETVTDPLHKADNTRTGAEDRIQNRVDEQTKHHFRRVTGLIDQLLRSDGYDVLVAGREKHELPEFLQLLPHDLRGRAVIGTGGSARQIAADLMTEEYIAAAKLRFPPPPPDQGAVCENDRLCGLQLRVLLPGQPAGGPAGACGHGAGGLARGRAFAAAPRHWRQAQPTRRGQDSE